jgi:hypothetical protein
MYVTVEVFFIFYNNIFFDNRQKHRELKRTFADGINASKSHGKKI